MDLFWLYRVIVGKGGYDAVNGRLGGWTQVYKDLPDNTHVDTSGSNRVKRTYERLLLEYERRCGCPEPVFNPAAPTPYPLLTAGFVHPAAGSGLPEAPAPLPPVPTPSGATPLAPVPKEYLAVPTAGVPGRKPRGPKPKAGPGRPPKRPVGELGADEDEEEGGGEEGGGGEGGGGGGGGGSGSSSSSSGAGLAAKRQKMSLANTSTSAYGVNDSRAGTGAYGAFDCAAAYMALPLLEVAWLAPEAVPLRLDAVVRGVPALCGSGSGSGCEGGAEEDAAVAAEGLARCLAGQEGAGGRRGRGGGSQHHIKACARCAYPRHVASAAAAGAAAAAGGGGGGKGGDMDTEDEREGAGAPGSPAAAEPAEGAASASSPPGAEAPAAAGYKPRAWALCASCPIAVCLPCQLAGHPALAGQQEAAREALLAPVSAAAAAAAAGSSLPSLGEAGLWHCARCSLQAGAGYEALPWCGGCLGELGAAPTGRSDSALGDLAVLQRNRALASPPPHWPPLVHCGACSQRFHGPCAWRAEAVECLEEWGVGGVRRRVFLCKPCVGGGGKVA